jgi:hypothetical protein
MGIVEISPIMVVVVVIVVPSVAESVGMMQSTRRAPNQESFSVKHTTFIC